MDTEGSQFEFNALSITAEDADPFALVPKEEPLDENEGQVDLDLDHPNQSDLQESRKQNLDKEGDTAETVTESSSTNSMCMICNGTIKIQTKLRIAQKQLLAEFLCKLFGFPSLPYETEFYGAQYCSCCHKKILEVGQLFKSLERIQNNILETRIQLEKQISESSLQVSKANKEILTNLSQEQLRMQKIRQKIVDKLSNSETEHVQPVEVPQINELGLLNEPENDEPWTKAQTVEVEVPNDSDWTPDSPIDVEDSDCDGSDYQPLVLTPVRKSKRTIKNAVAPKINSKSIKGTNSENNEKLKSISKICKIPGVQNIKGKILIVKLEKLTNKLENVKISRALKKSSKRILKSSPKIKIKKQMKNTEDVEKHSFRCSICNRRFQDQVRMTAHVKRFHEGLAYPYSCDHPNCNKCFKALPALNLHKMDHSKETPFVCDFCGKGCKTATLLDSHQKNKHMDISTRPFKCDTCGRAFIALHYLKTHHLSHTKAYPFICEICGKGFAMSTHMKVHVAAKHSEENPYTCEYDNCGKSFCNKKTLEQHQFIHNKNYPFTCEVCGLGCVAQHALKKHMRKHTEVKEFQCELCEKKFRYPHSIKKHMMSHKGIKNFECDQCEKKFIDRYKLNRHKRLHSGSRPYQCQICHKCFYTKDYLNIHIGYHNKAAEQGKGTINEAKIKRTLDTGVSGARTSTGSMAAARTTKVQSNQVDVNESDISRKSLDLTNNEAVVTHHSASTSSSANYPVILPPVSIPPADVFFQGDFYPIFPQRY